jgi:flagellar protein FlaI
MVNFKQRLTGVFKHKNEVNTGVNKLLQTKYRELIKKKAEELEQQFLQKKEIPDKSVHQEELSYMRRELARNKMDLNVTYPINPPFAFANIYFDKQEGEFTYLIKEPHLKEEEQETLEEVKEKIEESMDEEELPLEEKTMFSKSKKMKNYLKKSFNNIIELYDIDVKEKRKPIVVYHLECDLLGLGRSDAIIRDPYVEDIGCNGPNVPLYLYHRVFGSMKTNVVYTNELELNKFIFKLAQISGRHISVYQPILDAVLADGSRINLTLGSEVTRKGSTFTIRKFSYDPISPIDLLRFGSISPLELAYFWLLIEHKKSILMSGGTASGKTTLLNALCMFVRPEDKIVSIEDTPEIHIDHENWIQSVSRKGYGKVSGLSGISGISGVSGIGGMSHSPGDVDLFDLLVAALRQRPEYVIVGEIRGREAFTLFQAIAVGHASMSTVHAGAIGELLHRVESQPMNIPRVLFSSIDAVAFVGQVNIEGKRMRRVKEIIEVLEIEPESKNLLTNDAFTWNPRGDFFHFSGRSFILEGISQEIGKDIDEVLDELRRKESYIKLMDQQDITYYKDVSRAINMYYVDPINAAMELNKRNS